MSSAPLPDSLALAQVACPKCGLLIPCYDTAHSSFFGCPSCRTLFEQGKSVPSRQLRRFKEKPFIQPTLAVGATGKLAGEPYRVTGYMWRRETKSTAHWDEYLLRHEETGAYRQVAVYEGHWMFIEPAQEAYKVQKATSNQAFVETPDDTFRLYNRYSPCILYAEGEFDWNILTDETLRIDEFISPPQMLIRERSKSKQIEWYVGRHLDAAEIQTGFQVTSSRMPWRNGVGAVQPMAGQAHWPILRTFALVMALVVVVTHLVLMWWGNETVLNADFVSSPSSASTQIVPAGGNDRTTHVSPSFTVPNTGALSIELWANVDNNWVELPFSVVNEQTGQLFEVTRGLEYYHGVEGGESWSEGNTEASATLASVPAGRYHLNFYPSSDPSNQSSIRFRVTVLARASSGSNALLALFLLLIYPAFQYIRHQYQEQKRWENSDYAPVSAS